MLARMGFLAVILGLVGLIGCGGPTPEKSNLPASKEVKTKEKKAAAVSDSLTDMPGPTRK